MSIVKFRWINKKTKAKKWIYPTQFTWSGSATEASRTLEFALAHDYNDTDFLLKLEAGDIICMYINNKLKFVGFLKNEPRSGEIGTVSYTARDAMYLLLKSKTTHKFKNKTAEAITKILCSEIGIQIGEIEKTKYNIPKMFVTETEIYNVILKAYKKANAHTKKKYMPIMNGLKFSIIEKGKDSGVIVKSKENLISIESEKDIESVVNRVKVYDESGKKITTYQNESSIKKYGIYQEIYTKDSDEKKTEYDSAAKAMLEEPEETLSLTAIGNWNAISGYSMKLNRAVDGIKTGKYYIITDSHTYSNGNHKMTLELSKKNTMENVDVNTIEAKKSATSDSDLEKADSIITFAKKYIGKVKYVFGASSPNTGKSDCSGYTQYVYKKAAGILIGRTTSEQVKKGTKVEKKNLKKGDLVFFQGTYRTGVSHVGIYIGNGKFIHCHSSGVSISKLSENYYAKHWLMGRRVLKTTKKSTKSKTSGKTVMVQYTAYYPSNSTLEGGYYAANGEKLNPSALTCAAPKSIPFGTKVVISGTGTKYDGKTYRVNDRGGGIKIKNGRYRIDILMSNRTECNNFGRRNGKAILK